MKECTNHDRVIHTYVEPEERSWHTVCIVLQFFNIC